MTDQVRPQVAGGVRTRTPRGSVNREKVVLAGVQAVLDRGVETMTIRGLARDLGVAPMTIYRHVHSRQELVDAVAEELVARQWRPSRDHADWRTWTMHAAINFRDILVHHPTVLQVYLRHPVYSPGAVERLGEMLERLRAAGFSDQLATRTCAAVHTYTVGCAALESSRSKWKLGHPELHDNAFDQLVGLTDAEHFFNGMKYLLDGIARELAEESR